MWEVLPQAGLGKASYRAAPLPGVGSGGRSLALSQIEPEPSFPRHASGQGEVLPLWHRGMTWIITRAGTFTDRVAGAGMCLGFRSIQINVPKAMGSALAGMTEPLSPICLRVANGSPAPNLTGKARLRSSRRVGLIRHTSAR